MKVKFVDRKGDQPGNVHAYAEKKVTKLDRFFRSDAEATVTFTTQKKGQIKVEVAVNTAGTLYRGESVTTDARASVDAAISAIEGQIRKYKTRLSRRLRDEIPSLEEPESSDAAAEAGADDIRIVRTKRFALKPMNVEEAVLQMNMTGHSFFVFRNSEDGDAVAVVYARNDGGYGLIEDMDEE